MDRWRGKVALVTGASSGIGAAAAIALADSGMRVVAVARRLELVENLSKQVAGSGQIYPRRCDVSRDDQVQELFRYLKTSLGGVDVVVNNAALLPFGTITDCSTKQLSMEEISSMFDVNVRAAVVCTRLAVQSMNERKASGHVLFINSIAGHYIPHNGDTMEFNVYPATKHAITAITEVIRRESFSFNNIPIRVTSVSPGAVQTDMIRGLVDPAQRIPLLKPADIAAAILYAISAPQHVNIKDIIIHPTGERF